MGSLESEEFTRWRFHVRLLTGERLRVREYTGKLVKSFLAECSEALREAIRSSKPGVAKRVSVSPLFRVKGLAKVEAVYPGGWSRESIREPTLEDGEVVYFDVSLAGPYAPEIQRLVECASQGVTVKFQGRDVHLEPLTIEEVATWRLGDEPLVDVSRASHVKIVFMAPVLPVNPWRSGSRWKRLLPTPSYLLAVNAHDLFDPDEEVYRRAVIAAERILSPSYTTIETVRIRWYRYDGSILPGLVGYIKLHVEEGGDDEARLVSMLLSHAAVMGLGSSRAAGFGTISLEFEERGS